ncbi:type IV secretion system protein VirB1 [Dyella sp. OK004]|uniref:lytic transglycosylase domain-containing protein n=1 Tax=Dyella sp. OK004 TaxID=1855292 RepID=UPI0008EC9FC2|nr:type IV secretion system protein VirB1 [Dyella sp. OK004]
MMPFAIDMATCPNLAVPAEVMQHIVNVESGSNPFAIGVVGAHLERQPQNKDEAVATAQMLESQGYNFSLGIAQINRYNLAKYGLGTYEQAFDACPNLVAGARILAQCYAQAGGDWGKSFSCYYSGNFSKGYDDGYVQKVYDSINRASPSSATAARAIPIQLAQTRPPKPVSAEQYLVSMRSSAIDNLGAALASNVLQNRQPVASVPSAAPVAMPASAPSPMGTPVSPNDLPIAAAAPANEVFVPQVRGPNDGATTAKQNNQPSQPAIDQADLRLQGRDDAFVF